MDSQVGASSPPALLQRPSVHSWIFSQFESSEFVQKSLKVGTTTPAAPSQ